MKNIYNYTLTDLEEYFKQIGDKAFRAKQVFDWLYKKRINNFSEMKKIKTDILKKKEKNF